MTFKGVGLLGLGLLFAGGAYWTYHNADDSRRIAARDRLPTPLSVADLSAKGPGELKYIALTGYAFDPNDVVITKMEKASGFFSASCVLRPIGRPLVAGQPRVVVIKSAKSAAEIKCFMATTTGAIVGSFTNSRVNGIAQPHEWKVKGRPTEMAYFLAEGEPPSVPLDPEIMMGLLGVGSLICLGLGALSMGGGRRRQPVNDFAWHNPGVEMRSAAFFPQRPDAR